MFHYNYKSFSFSILSRYYFLIILIVVSLFRLFYFALPNAKEKNFVVHVTISNPIYIEESQKIIKTSEYKILTYDLPYKRSSNDRILELGDIVKVTGTRYHNLIYADKIEFIKESKIKFLLKIKGLFIKASNTMLSEPLASLLNGILIGVEPVISMEYKEVLIKVGVIHIIVVSGYNISVLFSIATKALNAFSIKFRIFLGIFLAIIYCFIVGFEPPVIRALVMGTIAGSGVAFGKVRSTLYIFLISALAMIIYNPHFFYSLSFQLTIMATLGIILLSGVMRVTFDRFRVVSFIPKLLKEDFYASFSAQLFVLPIISFYFGRVSLLGFVVNPLILWIIPIIMVIGFIYGLFFVLGFWFLLKYFTFLLEAPLMFFNDFVSLVAKIPTGVVDISIDFYILVLYYSLIFIFLLYFYKIFRIPFLKKLYN